MTNQRPRSRQSTRGGLVWGIAGRSSWAHLEPASIRISHPAGRAVIWAAGSLAASERPTTAPEPRGGFQIQIRQAAFAQLVTGRRWSER